VSTRYFSIAGQKQSATRNRRFLVVAKIRAVLTGVRKRTRGENTVA
jgi:hypothetical protein